MNRTYLKKVAVIYIFLKEGERGEGARWIDGHPARTHAHTHLRWCWLAVLHSVSLLVLVTLPAPIWLKAGVMRAASLLWSQLGNSSNRKMREHSASSITLEIAIPHGRRIYKEPFLRRKFNLEIIFCNDRY